jgi:hypothetical protein
LGYAAVIEWLNPDVNATGAQAGRSIAIGDGTAA